MNTSKTPLYYAEIAGLTGLCFAVGPTMLFAPCESESIHVIPEGVPLHITAEVPGLFASHLQTAVIEPRLARLGGAHHGL
jgi:hypothetical protein